MAPTNQPALWAVLAVISIGGAGTRLMVRRPLWPARSSVLLPWELAVAGVSILVLIFHCAAMFFAGWVDLVPFSDGPAAAVRSLGTTSQVAYWVPAVALLAALRRLWRPAGGVLAVTLGGVGVTMFWQFELATHLAWIAAAVTVIAATSATLVATDADADARRDRG